MARGTKTGGRQKGTPNRTTREIRAMLSEIVSAEIEKIPKYLNAFEPEKRLHIIAKLLPYVVPTYAEEPTKELELRGKDFIMQLYRHSQVNVDSNDSINDPLNEGPLNAQ